MKNFLLCLLAISSVSAFANIGDLPTAKINDNELNTFNTGLVQFDLLRNGTKSTNSIKYNGPRNFIQSYRNNMS